MTVGWRRLPPADGHAYGRIVAIDDLVVFEGWEVVASAIAGYAVRFRLVVGPDVVARALEVDADGPHGLRRLSVRRDPKGHWWADGRRRTDLDGCLDVDVAAMPLATAPAIRRLDLPVGGTAAIVVARVDVPSVIVSPMEWRYERLPSDEPGAHR